MDNGKNITGKVCIACGFEPKVLKKPMDEPEDCENCGKDGTVKKLPDELDSAKNETSQ